jgi:hypothetical protein
LLNRQQLRDEAWGVLDGGLDVPHSEKRFPGFSKEDKS